MKKYDFINEQNKTWYLESNRWNNVGNVAEYRSSASTHCEILKQTCKHL